MIALAAHSISIHLWLKPDSSRLLDLQKRFIDQGGVVLRILVGLDFEMDDKYKYVKCYGRRWDRS